MNWGLVPAIIGAALAVGLSGFGSAMGISYPAQAANGVLAEDPEKFGSLLMLIVLPGTQGFYGFVAAFFVMVKLGFFGGGAQVVPTLSQGFQILGACLPIAGGGWISAIFQGRVSAAGVGLVAKRPKEFMKSVIFSALVETYAILGLLATILILMGIKM